MKLRLKNKHVKHLLLLGTLVPDSRDEHEKMVTKIYAPQNTLKYALFEKSRLKCTSNAINNIALISTK